MAQSYEEWQDAHIEEQRKLQNEAREELSVDAEPAYEGGPSGPLSGEAAEEHLRNVRGTMIFGDTDTTGGTGANVTDVPSSDNEAATVAAAEVQADREAGDEQTEGVSNDEARRQVDVAAGTTESAEEVDAGAEARADEEGEGDVSPANQEQGNQAQQTAAEKVRAIQEAESVEEVDELAADDERVTVRQAAEKRRGELAEE